MTKNKKIGIIACCVAAVILLTIIIGIVLGAKSCKKPKDGDIEEYTPEYTAFSAVGYSAENLGTVERHKPVEGVTDEGAYFDNAAYPVYGQNLGSVLGDDNVQARQNIIAESGYLAAYGTGNANGGELTPEKYTFIDKDGFLYQGTVESPVAAIGKDGQPRRLYKHTAATGLYLGDVADGEKGIIKRVTMRPRGYSGYGITGVYAPAGEVLKIEMSEADMNATGGITIHIGQALFSGNANNIWTEKNQMPRIPHLLNTLQINKNTAEYDATAKTYTAYIGSFIGGPVYIRNEGVTFTATISGGVTYSHFILGYTTKAEFEQNAESSAPYFDLEVWDRGVLHSGPAKYAQDFTYDELYEAAVLWDKVSTVTTTGVNQGIVFLYDPFVAAGAAVAFVGARSVNCPLSWMSSSLNYQAIVTSGSWGNFHEYHHNFQGYGVGGGGEVTNNGMTLVSYALFTKVSAARQMGNYGAERLGGDWNRYTSATFAQSQVNKIKYDGESPDNGNNGLALYATLLHNFGADAYIKAKVAGGGESYAAYMNAWQQVTHNNMYYYFNELLGGTGIEDNADPAFPVFVPLSSVYQTGRSYTYYNEETGKKEKRYIKTMQPYQIPYGKEFEIDLSPYVMSDGKYSGGSIILPTNPDKSERFTYKVNSVSDPAHGSIKKTDSLHYVYTPDAGSPTSGQITVNVSVTDKKGLLKVDDVDLTLEFAQSKEFDKNVLKRTTYTYTAEGMYADAEEAFENGFKGYTEVSERDHTNPTQNCNTDIWFYPNDEATHNRYPEAPEEHFIHDNQIDVLDGKLYFEKDGKYRIYLRGRENCALYYSLNGNEYGLGATIKQVYSDHSKFQPNDEKTYFDVEYSEGKVTVSTYAGGTEHTREYTLTKDKNGEFNNFIYIKEVLIDTSTAGGRTLASYIGVGYNSWTKTDGGWVAPSSANYATAYRTDYELPDKNFTSDYFYKRGYNLNYTGDTLKYSTWDDGVSLADTNFVHESDLYKIENLFKEGTDTFIHPPRYGGNNVFITLDMGKEITANSVTFLGRNDAANTARQGMPKEFKLEISSDGVTYTDAGTYTNPTGATLGATVNLGKELTFRYVKITVINTHSNTERLILSGIEFTYTFALSGNGANVIAPDGDGATFIGEWKTEQAFSTFGKVYVGKSGSSVKTEFTGTRFAILTSGKFGSDYEVYIDGKKVDSVEVKEQQNGYGITYISQKLSEGNHKVEIKCLGETAFDSFAYYTE